MTTPDELRVCFVGAAFVTSWIGCGLAIPIFFLCEYARRMIRAARTRIFKRL